MSLLDVTSQQTAWMYHVSRLGVYVYQVNSGSGAEAAGLRSGDCILSFNGVSIESSSDITALLTDLQAGDTVSVEIYRNGQAQTLTMTVDQYVPDAVQERLSSSSSAETF
jgi:serine protease Do